MEDKNEEQSLDRELISKQFDVLDQILITNGSSGDADRSGVERKLRFTIDRSSDPESLFTADQIEIFKLSQHNPLENYIGKKAGNIRTAKNERWISISVEPLTPYKSKIGVVIEPDGHKEYYTEDKEVFISNLGQAFERTGWSCALRPDIHTEQNPSISYLKEIPQDPIRLEDDPVHTEVLTELKTISGQTLEGLQFIISRIKQNDIAIFNPGVNTMHAKNATLDI